MSGAGGRWGTGVGAGGEFASAVEASAVEAAVEAASGWVRGRPMGGVGDASLAFSL
jgi:hypothetical protein